MTIKKDQLIDLLDVIREDSVHIVKEMHIRDIPEGATVFVCGWWLRWQGGWLERTRYHVKGHSDDGQLHYYIVRDHKLLVKL